MATTEIITPPVVPHAGYGSYAGVTLVNPTIEATQHLGQFRLGFDEFRQGAIFLTPELARQWIAVLTPLAEVKS